MESLETQIEWAEPADILPWVRIVGSAGSYHRRNTVGMKSDYHDIRTKLEANLLKLGINYYIDYYEADAYMNRIYEDQFAGEGVFEYLPLPEYYVEEYKVSSFNQLMRLKLAFG